MKYIVDAFMGPGGPFMWAILLISVIGISIVAERFFYLIIKCRLEKEDFMAKIAKLVTAGEIEKAVDMAKKSGSPVSKLFYVILLNYKESEKDIKDAVDEVFLTEAPKIARFTNLLTVVANIATLSGLLGTIIGLILDFDAVANVPAAQKAAALAAGISVALATTAFGLCVAIPCLFFHGLIQTQSDKIVEEMDEKSAKLLHFVVNRNKK
jgi:biopolymer transport protein ExbB